jgi:quinol monooxygenase YgiN
MSGFGLVVRFTLQDEAAAEVFDDLVNETLEGIQSSEPGTLVYVSHSDTNATLVRVFYELYADREAFDRHEQQPYVKHFLTAREPLLAGLEVTFLDQLAGKLPGAGK